MALAQRLKTVEFVAVHHLDGSKLAIPNTEAPSNFAEGALDTLKTEWKFQGTKAFSMLLHIHSCHSHIMTY